MKIRDLFEPKSYETPSGSGAFQFGSFLVTKQTESTSIICSSCSSTFPTLHNFPNYQLCIFIMFSWPYIRSYSVINTKTGKILSVLVLMPSGRQWKLNCSNNYLMICFIIKQMFLKHLVEGFMYQNGQGRKYSIKKS